MSTTDIASEVPGKAQPTEIAARSPWELFWRRLKGDKLALFALIVILLLVLMAIFAPWVVKLFGGHDPQRAFGKKLDSIGLPSGPDGDFLFGVDKLGRDVFSRTVYGARISLQVATIATGIALVVGVFAGVLAGYYRGWVDTLLSRVMDVMLGFPVLLLGFGLGTACGFTGCFQVNIGSAALYLVLFGLIIALARIIWRFIQTRTTGEGRTPRELLGVATPGLTIIVAALILLLILGSGKHTLVKPGLPIVIFIITISSWPYVARIIRGQVLSLREKEFVEAAKALGASDWRIMSREILPNLVAPIIVYATLIIPTNILLEAALSFLGIGVQPDQPSWGAMLADAIEIFDTAWWYMLFPGLALLITVLAFNLLGDGLRDALDPRGGGQK